MKKNILFYLLGLIAITFASCDPLDDTIGEIKPVADEKALVITTTTQYGTPEAANTGIAAMLNKSYPQFSDGKTANVTYSFRSNIIKPADSIYANTLYTVTDADYLVTHPTFKTFTDAQVLTFLESKYPQATTPANKLVLLAYQFFQSNVTTSAGIPATHAFLLSANGWQKIYLVTPAQYTSLGRGVNNGFTSADVANLPAYFNTLLKADPNVVPKVGDVRYITYKYMQSSTIIHQKIFALSFDVTGNWIPSLTPAFIKQNGKWIPDPTIYYTLVRNDYNTIGGSTAGTAAGRSNLSQFGSFDVSGGANHWTEDHIAAGLIVILNAKYPNAVADPNVPYKVTYALFRGSGPTGSKIFIKTNTGFVVKP